MLVGRNHNPMHLVMDGETLYMLGGAPPSSANGRLRSAEVYHAENQTFTMFPGLYLPVGLTWGIAIQVERDKVFLGFGRRAGKKKVGS